MAWIILQLIKMSIFFFPSGTILPHLKCLREKLKQATCAFLHKRALYINTAHTSDTSNGFEESCVYYVGL